jgi:hypothetical protein
MGAGSGRFDALEPSRERFHITKCGSARPQRVSGAETISCVRLVVPIDGMLIGALAFETDALRTDGQGDTFGVSPRASRCSCRESMPRR